jgi:hypothetical protein
LETYLQNKVNEYNAILSATKATTANAPAYNELQKMGFTRATPIGRTYQGHLFTYNDLLQAL